jgi:hypothetical protein
MSAAIEPPPSTEERQGDPLDGLWTWRDHPLAGIGLALVIMAASLIIFPLLAQVMF